MPVELMRTGHTFSMLHSMYSALVTDRIDPNAPNDLQARSHLFAFSSDAQPVSNQTWVIESPEWYSMLIQEIRFQWRRSDLDKADYIGDLMWELQQPSLGRVVTSGRIPARLTSTPADQQPDAVVATIDQTYYYNMGLNTFMGPQQRAVINLWWEPAFTPALLPGLHACAATTWFPITRRNV